jgi:hypothetical protein
VAGLDEARVLQRLEEIGELPRPRTDEGGDGPSTSTSPAAPTSPPAPGELTGGTAPPLPKSNSAEDQLAFNRAMAAWALRNPRGGVAVVFPDGTRQSGIRKVQDLPAGPFLVVELHLSRCGVEDGDIPKLTALPKLELVNLADNPLSNQGMAMLGASKSLLHVNLYTTPLDDHALTQICLGLPNLTELQVGRTSVTDDGLEAVGRLSHLLRLTLTEDDITDDGLPHLMGLGNLEHLHRLCLSVCSNILRGLQAQLPDAGLRRISRKTR